MDPADAKPVILVMEIVLVSYVRYIHRRRENPLCFYQPSEIGCVFACSVRKLTFTVGFSVDTELS